MRICSTACDRDECLFILVSAYTRFRLPSEKVCTAEATIGCSHPQAEAERPSAAPKSSNGAQLCL
jgi:hypothetical protein